MSNSFKFILLFIFLYVFRTLFGLTQTFFSPDEIQTYLIGLKFYCTHAWPFFGPDLIVTETGFYSQIPGPLEGLLIGGPLWILPIPGSSFSYIEPPFPGRAGFIRPGHSSKGSRYSLPVHFRLDFTSALEPS